MHESGADGRGIRRLLGGRDGAPSRLVESAARAVDARAVRNVWPEGPEWWRAATRSLGHRYRSMDAWSPSYLRLLAAQRRYVGPRFGPEEGRNATGALDARIRILDRKLVTYELLDLLAVPHPDLYGVWPDIREVDLEALPDRFCLKAADGSTSQGVLLLERRSPGTYLEALRRSTMTADAIVELLRDEADRERVTRQVFAEAWIDATDREAAPYDWKAYSFYGEIGCILQMRRLPGQRSRLKFYAPDGEDMGKVRDPERCDPTLPVSPHLARMVEMAERVSAALPMPFIRVDMFDGPDGPMVGEVTPTPGGQQLFRRDVDESLGLMWEAAERRLVDDMLAGREFPEFTKVTSTGG